ncbi:hypothetical protein AiwAL_15640 [Acidiphilium sp. AL]|uniref:Uncharacterized protein n=1 Tax=Acidiphilium iwatense TaxID=768198 RepID=A0ABS9E2H1_9PROT|nr:MULTISPECIES: hypothetical protein [Acidiphilium]MCF3948131.1 hypothetical protein [Acidiphilium iwatense]MCU4161518.1 hypothetical protein [Acidiphilium sp. AL]
MIKRWRSRLTRPILAAVSAAAVAGALMVPHPAYAWWRPHPWWGPRFGIGITVPLAIPAPPPAYAYYGPPAYYAPRARVWIPPHYNWAGAYIPGHWVWR